MNPSEHLKPAVDPVCGMIVDPESCAGGTYEHEGKTYYFCNTGCREEFLFGPEEYVGPVERRTERPFITVLDLVCGMDVDAHACEGGTYQYKGQTYYFCDPRCREAFAKDPEKYIKAGEL